MEGNTRAAEYILQHCTAAIKNITDRTYMAIPTVVSDCIILFKSLCKFLAHSFAFILTTLRVCVCVLFGVSSAAL